MKRDVSKTYLLAVIRRVSSLFSNPLGDSNSFPFCVNFGLVIHICLLVITLCDTDSTDHHYCSSNEKLSTSLFVLSV